MLAQRSMAVRPVAAQRRAPVPVLRASGRPALRVVGSAMAPSPNSNEEFSKDNLGPVGQFSPNLSVPSSFTVQAKGGAGGAPNFGSGSSLGAVMERGRMDFVMPTPVVQGPKLDDGGSGGDIGKIIHNGGGGGDGGGDDDDDYFNEGDDEGGDGNGENARDGFFRTVIPESYDKFSIGAVLAEWMKTIQELPAILRQAVTMGLFSSAQLVRFFSMDVRPNLTRAVSRRLPPTMARDFVGRLMADPGFVQKMVLESAFAACASLWYEYRLRGDKFKDELDLVLINTLGMAAATGATAWLVAPSRSYGSIQKFPWQQMLDGLPNCVFDVSGPLRQYTKQARAAGFLAKMAELSAVGALTGTATSLLSAAAVAIRKKSNPEWEPSTAVPDVGRASAGLGAYFALNANTRYQLMGGLDRLLFDRTNYLWTYLLLSGAARVVSNQVGELSRPWWQGLPSPSSLAARSVLPMQRRVRKKVSKKVPKVKPGSQQQQGLEGEMAVMAAAAALPLAAEGLQGEVVVAEFASITAGEQAGVEVQAASSSAFAAEAAEGAVSEQQQQYEGLAEEQGQSMEESAAAGSVQQASSEQLVRQ